MNEPVLKLAQIRVHADTTSKRTFGRLPSMAADEYLLCTSTVQDSRTERTTDRCFTREHDGRAGSGSGSGRRPIDFQIDHDCQSFAVIAGMLCGVPASRVTLSQIFLWYRPFSFFCTQLREQPIVGRVWCPQLPSRGIDPATQDRPLLVRVSHGIVRKRLIISYGRVT